MSNNAAQPVKTQSPIVTLQGHQGVVFSLSFAPNGKLLASANGDKTVRIWEIQTGREVVRLADHFDQVHATAFSHDGKYLASGSWDGVVYVWDTKTWNKVRELCLPHKSSILCAAFDPKQNRLAVGTFAYSDQVYLLHLDQPNSPFVLRGHSAWVRELAFAPNSSLLATASGDGTAMLWDGSDANPIRVIKRHGAWVRTIAFSSDSKLVATGDSEGILRVLTIPACEEVSASKKLKDGINSVAFSHTADVIYVAFGDGYEAPGDLAVVETQSGLLVNSVRLHNRGIESVAISPDGRILATGSTDGTIKLWEATKLANPKNNGSSD